jgi:predicted nucleotidyltransferase
MDNETILSELKTTLTETFPDLIIKVLLFGSRATGTWNDDSDFDVLVVIRGKPGWRLQNEIINACYAIDLKFDIVTDVKVIAESDLDTPKGRQPYIRQAIALEKSYDSR